MKPPRYIDPTTDYGFKRIFSSEPNKDLLIAFINDLFRGRKKVSDLVFDKNEYMGDIDSMGTVILDLICTGNNGERFVIEVQRTSQFNFKRRMLYYGSRLIVDQAPKGNRKSWAYGISEVYVIAIMDGFQLRGSKQIGRYLHDVCLCDRDTKEVFYEGLEFIYVELINFTKEESELESDLDGWLYVLKNMSKMDKIPLYLRRPVFQKLFNIAEYSKLNEEEKAMYDVSLKRKWDNQNALDFARMEGIEKGIEISKEEVVRNLLAADKFTISEIASFVGVEDVFVENIRRKMK